MNINNSRHIKFYAKVEFIHLVSNSMLFKKLYFIKLIIPLTLREIKDTGYLIKGHLSDTLK